MKSDFLTRVAQRALGVLPDVRPVVGSRFAPAPDLSWPAHPRAEDGSGENPAEQKSDSRLHSFDQLSSARSNESAPPAPVTRAADATSIPTQFEPTKRNVMAPKRVRARVPAGSDPAVPKFVEEGFDQPTPLESGNPAIAVDDVRVVAHQVNDVAESGPAGRIEADTAGSSVSKVGQSKTGRGALNSVQTSESTTSETIGSETQVSQAAAWNTARSRTASPETGASELTILPVLNSHEASHDSENLEKASQRVVAEHKPASDSGRPPDDAAAIPVDGRANFSAADRRSGAHPDEPVEAALAAVIKPHAVDRGSLSEETPLVRSSSGQPARLTAGANSMVGPHSREASQPQLSLSKPVEAQSPSEKIVRVSIGRIDVRAVMPPAAPPVESTGPPAPQLSLDEFLRRQEQKPR